MFALRQRVLPKYGPANPRHYSINSVSLAPAAQRRALRLVPRSGPTDVFVLDFDGVLLDSEPEITASALVSAVKHWPSIAPQVEARRAQLTGLMKRCRPVLVRGYESMVMVRLLVEDPEQVDQILADWERLLPGSLQRWGESSEVLTKAFEAVRSEWMNERTQSWMEIQKPYPGLVDAMRDCPYPTYIATSKAGNRVSALLRTLFDIDVPEDSPRLFAALLPPEEAKANALRTIGQRPICQGATLHFIDDRLDTLLHIRSVPDLQHWKLYFAKDGYSTPEEQQRARSAQGVRTISHAAAAELLRFGLVMGVDDGCEPTAEEVARGVFRAPKREVDDE